MEICNLNVLCVGYASYDLIMEVDHHPGPDEKCFATHFAGCGGGPAANASVAVVRLGGTSAFVGYLGEDEYGEKHLKELSAEGVVIDWVGRGSNPTPLSVILVKPNGDRCVVSYKGGKPFLDPDASIFSKCFADVILFDGHELPLSLVLAKRAKNSGVPVVLDAGSVHAGTRSLIPYTDYLVASARFARDFTGRRNPQAAVEELHRYAAFAVVTLGEDGLAWASKKGSGTMPAFEIDAVDTTGAGDAFHGAFAFAISMGVDFQTALRWASAAGALCCTKLGARVGLPTKPQLEAFLAEYEHRV